MSSFTKVKCPILRYNALTQRGIIGIWVTLNVLFKQMNDHDRDELLDVVRCERCGHRLENEIECRFCRTFDEPVARSGLPKWIYLTACFLTSPFSIYFIIKSTRLNVLEK